MAETQRLIEIAKGIGADDLSKKLIELHNKINQKDCPLVLPLVGEFSSGKTTLINSLTDSKKLETATTPTTATIYEIFFGCDKCSALVVNGDGTTNNIDDIAELKNDNLKDAAVVSVFDTSTKIPPLTVLVDTPGLSSTDPKHRQVLTDFLPNADGVLLVTDVNQQITHSLTDFIKDMSLANRPIFAVITKCDTKSKDEVESAKKYISENCKLAINQIACVSANNNDIKELLDLLKTVSDEKTKILEIVNAQRLKNLTSMLSDRIDETIKATTSDKELEKSLQKQKSDLERIKRNIESLVNDVQGESDSIKRKICNEFEDSITNKLEYIVANKSANFDADVTNAINSMASIYFNKYKNGMQQTLLELANERRTNDNSVNLSSIAEVNLSSLQMSAESMKYNLNLNELGHEYDGMIAFGAKAAVAVALVAATVATAGGAAAAAGAGTAAAGAGAAAGGAAAAGAGTGAVIASGTAATISVADTISDVASMLHNQKVMKDMDKKMEQLQKQMQKVDMIDQQAGNLTAKKGIVIEFVSKITDGMGKPQRQKAIREYLENQLIPSFSQELQKIGIDLTILVQNQLNNEAEQLIAEKTKMLEELKTQFEQSKSEYEARIKQLHEYKREIA